MRCDQFMGITPEARDFLAKNEVAPEPCSCCHRPYLPVWESCGSYAGMFDERHELFRHKLKDGRYADEYVQAAPWSSGPVFFIGLKVYDIEGNVTIDYLWLDEEIKNA